MFSLKPITPLNLFNSLVKLIQFPYLLELPLFSLNYFITPPKFKIGWEKLIAVMIHQLKNDSWNYTPTEKGNMLELTQQRKPDKKKKLNIRIKIAALQTKVWELINKQTQTLCNQLIKTKTFMMTSPPLWGY